MNIIFDENRNLLVQDSGHTSEIEDFIKEKWGSFLEQDFRGQWEGAKNAEIMFEENHAKHNSDPEYQEFIIEPIKSRKDFWNGKRALDIGCGTGRNIYNLLSSANFSSVDGCDISESNTKKAEEYVTRTFDKTQVKTWRNNGINLRPAKDDTYDFVMSHIVFQHIPNYLIRLSLLNDVFRVLKHGGMTIIHYMDLDESEPYNSIYPGDSKNLISKNCRVGNANLLINDFRSLGFKDVNFFVGVDPFAHKPSYYVRAYKR